MSKLSKREKILLIVLLVALSGLVYYNFILKSFIAANDAQNVEIEDAKSSISDYKIKATTIRLIEEKLSALHEESDGELDRVIEGVDRPKILMMLDETVAGVIIDPDYYFPTGYITLKENLITTVEVSFICTEEQMIEILEALQDADIVNRVLIANYRVSDFETGAGNAYIYIEILTRGSIPPVT